MKSVSIVALMIGFAFAVFALQPNIQAAPQVDKLGTDLERRVERLENLVRKLSLNLERMQIAGGGSAGNLNLGVDVGPIDKLAKPEETTVGLGATDALALQQKLIKPKLPGENVFGARKPYPMRVWTSARGSRTNLALVRVEGDIIVVVDEKGKQFSMPFDRFSKEDQAYCRHAG